MPKTRYNNRINEEDILKQMDKKRGDNEMDNEGRGASEQNSVSNFNHTLEMDKLTACIYANLGLLLQPLYSSYHIHKMQ